MDDTATTSQTSTAARKELTEPYPVRDGHRHAFEADGFVHLRDVLSADTVAGFEQEITAKVLELNTQHLAMAERTTFERAFLQVMNLWRHSERVRELVHAQRLARIAADLMGVRGVRLYHDQALYKEPGGGITPWHADQYYWPFDSDRTCTVWLPLQETPAPMGPLSFAVGSHRLDLGRDQPIGDESEARIQERLHEQELDVASEPFALGDASFHQGWTFHRAEPNRTAVPRRVMTVIYVDADITVAEPTDSTRGDLETWLPGARVGGVPDTPLNPVLFAHPS